MTNGFQKFQDPIDWCFDVGAQCLEPRRWNPMFKSPEARIVHEHALVQSRATIGPSLDLHLLDRADCSWSFPPKCAVYLGAVARRTRL